jgi:hypothetical protein
MFFTSWNGLQSNLSKSFYHKMWKWTMCIISATLWSRMARGGTAPRILNLGTIRTWVVSITWIYWRRDFLRSAQPRTQPHCIRLLSAELPPPNSRFIHILITADISLIRRNAARCGRVTNHTPLRVKVCKVPSFLLYQPTLWSLWNYINTTLNHID